MKKSPSNKKPKAEHKSDEPVLNGAQEAGTLKEVCKDEHIKKQFAQDALIYERIKCPIVAIACCFIHKI